MILQPVKMIDLLILCENARADEVDQYQALRGIVWDADELAHDLYARAGQKFSLWNDAGTEVVVAGGWGPVLPGVYQSWMVGTDAAWGRYWRGITKASRVVMDALLAQDARRLQTMALAKRTGACNWYERGLKMTLEGTLRGFAANGEDAVMYSRLRAA